MYGGVAVENEESAQVVRQLIRRARVNLIAGIALTLEERRCLANITSFALATKSGVIEVHEVNE